MKRLLLLLMIVPIIGFGQQITDSEFSRCASIEGDLERLECFDKIARTYNLNGEQTVPTTIDDIGEWNIEIKTNPIDDSKTVVLSLYADVGSNYLNERVYIIIRCKSEETDLYIGWRDYLGSSASVLTRVGTSEATTTSWSLSTDGTSTFHRDPIPFIKELLESNKLVAQITPYSSSPVTAIFYTTGLSNAIQPVREICGW